MNISSELDIAWAAGLFEGEGSAYILKSQNRPTIELSSTDEDVITKFYRIVGVGNVYRVDREKGNKVYWRWATSRKDDVILVLELLIPFLCSRRTREAVATIDCARSKAEYKKRKTRKEEMELLNKLGFR